MTTTEDTLDETYDWAKQVSKDFEVMASRAEDVGALNKELSNGGDHKFHTHNFVKVERPSFLAEVGRADGANGEENEDLVFHFFPVYDEKYSIRTDVVTRGEDGAPKKHDRWDFVSAFPDILGDSFLAIFKQEDKLCWDYVPEMTSWVVRCQGFGTNIMANQLAEKLFADLQGRLER